MLQNNKSSLDTKKPKKLFRKKLIIYLILILMLIIIGTVGYFKFNKYLTSTFSNYETSSLPVINTKNNKESACTELTTVDSKNVNLFSEVLQKQTEFQNDLTQRMFNLEKEVKSSINVNERSLLLSKITNLEQQISLLSNKKDYIKSFTIIYNFILALKGNTPFLVELDSFNSTFLAQNYTNEIEVLSTIANKGIPNNYDLANDIDLLFPQLKTAIYKLDKSILGKIKYYLSYIFIIQKDKGFMVGDKSIDSIVHDIKTELLNNSPENSLAIVENNNLQSLDILKSWYINLNYRVKANVLASKLQQYLINANSGK